MAKKTNEVTSTPIELVKVKFPDSGGLHIKYHHFKQYGASEFDDRQYEVVDETKSTINISKKLLDAKRELDRHLAYSNHMIGVDVMLKPWKDLSASEQKKFKELCDKIEITSIEWKNGTSVRLKGVIEGVDGGTINIESTFIDLMDEAYPFSNQLSDDLDEVVGLVKAYIEGIRQNKQLSLFASVMEVEGKQEELSQAV